MCRPSAETKSEAYFALWFDIIPHISEAAIARTCGSDLPPVGEGQDGGIWGAATLHFNLPRLGEDS
jgi:hypothetical protein